MDPYTQPHGHFRDVHNEPPFGFEPNPGAAPPRDKKADYTLILQNACASALQRMKSNEIIANSSWADPLAAAPLAISTMAILLKAADKEAAGGLEIESQDVLEDGKPVGRLP